MINQSTKRPTHDPTHGTSREKIMPNAHNNSIDLRLAACVDLPPHAARDNPNQDTEPLNQSGHNPIPADESAAPYTPRTNESHLAHDLITRPNPSSPSDEHAHSSQTQKAAAFDADDHHQSRSQHTPLCLEHVYRKRSRRRRSSPARRGLAVLALGRGRSSVGSRRSGRRRSVRSLGCTLLVCGGCAVALLVCSGFRRWRCRCRCRCRCRLFCFMC